MQGLEKVLYKREIYKKGKKSIYIKYFELKLDGE